MFGNYYSVFLITLLMGATGSMYSMPVNPFDEAIAGLENSSWWQSYEYRWTATTRHNNAQRSVRFGLPGLSKEISFFVNKYTIGAACGVVIAVLCYRAYQEKADQEMEQDSNQVLNEQ